MNPTYEPLPCVKCQGNIPEDDLTCTWNEDREIWLCDSCGSPLQVDYDYVD